MRLRKSAALQLQVLKLLQLVAHQVQPILRARKWRVPLLSEFSPNNPCLLVKTDPRNIFTQARLTCDFAAITSCMTVSSEQRCARPAASLVCASQPLLRQALLAPSQVNDSWSLICHWLVVCYIKSCKNQDASQDKVAEAHAVLCSPHSLRDQR